MTPMLEFIQVHKSFGATQVINDINAEVKAGEVVVVCGPSGSGKSTLIRTVNRLEAIDRGTIRVNGRDVHAPGTDLNRLRTGIGFVFQQFNLFPHLSALDNVMLAPTQVRGTSKSEARAMAPCNSPPASTTSKPPPSANSSSCWASPASSALPAASPTARCSTSRAARGEQKALTEEPGGALQYGATEGYEPLRTPAQRLHEDQGRRRDPSGLIVTTGSQQALDLLGKTMISPATR
jgi:ABC-type dipeptide/oligopeptide/nickel transport system ATPase component